MDIKDHPMFVFRIEARPEFIEDLNEVNLSSSELVIHEKTKNLNLLRNFKCLDKLWIYKVKQKVFEEIIKQVNPKKLYIYEMTIDDLSIIGSLKELEILALEWNSKAKSLWDFSGNSKLKSLSLKDFSRLNDIEPIKDCENLKILDLSGSDSKNLNLKTLAPLKHIKNLEYLGLSNIRVVDDCLNPIAELKNLRKLEISNQFPTEEYAKLSVVLSNTDCEKFNAYVNLPIAIGGNDVMVVGKRKPLLNSKIHMKRLQKYERQFRDMQEKYRGI